MPDDFIPTIESDTEDGHPPAAATPGVANPDLVDESTYLNTEFTFDISGDSYEDAITHANEGRDIINVGSKPQPISVDDIIARRKLASLSRKRKRGIKDNSNPPPDLDIEDEGISGHGGDNGEEDDGASTSFRPDDDPDEDDPLATSSDEEASNLDPTKHPGDDDEYSDAASSSGHGTEPETQAELDRKAAFFDSETPVTEVLSSFLTMNLSRSILKALSALYFQKPTPIQAATIPVALLGKDVVGNAVTGSGKTAAFTIPMLERLLYREKGKQAAATRCLVLVPTRELAIQCLQVGSKLATFTDIRFCLVVGGLSLKAQEAELRTRPDIVIATPGRLIDHIRNSPSFTLDNLDILVLDEADRMLSDGFADELTEIIRSCPSSRQTMLFSATMTDSVDELVKMSLNKPLRLFVDPKRTIARGLIQEFVRVRAGKEKERSAMLVALCKRTFKHGVLIFFRSKKLAHQIRILFSLLDMKCEELHGDLSQEQRLRALQQFRDGTVDYLLATDLASRGLDIKGIETVINYDMPNQLVQYLHRVGRTARAGKKGRSVTLVGEADRKTLKAAIKHGAEADHIRHRVIAAEIISKWASKVEELNDEVAAILQEEKEEKQFRQAEMELKKGENMIEHEAEIYSKAPRTWFQTSKEKADAKALGKQQHVSSSSANKQKGSQRAERVKPKRDKYAGLSRKAKRRKIELESMDAMKNREVDAAVRSAKKAARPGKIGTSGPLFSGIAGVKKKMHPKKGSRAGVAFDMDVDQDASRRPTRREGKPQASSVKMNKRRRK